MDLPLPIRRLADTEVFLGQWDRCLTGVPMFRAGAVNHLYARTPEQPKQSATDLDATRFGVSACGIAQLTCCLLELLLQRTQISIVRHQIADLIVCAQKRA